ncbi:hypothetical protein CHITON_0690 [Thermococcus chitonophagus]|uniref:Uncharacterized protein n=1 Tax=Thermococcus chitonophagus TaxID=54262 RepID=A0A160VS51_9EURY|nr:hypothetical protein CHITON_0690 [Thermococcus chitonophagus]
MEVDILKKRWKDVLITAIESLILMWFIYAFLYQNYLLYKWHRGLPLPSKLPFILVGVASGLAFFFFEIDKLIKSSQEGISGVADGRSGEDPSNNKA